MKELSNTLKAYHILAELRQKVVEAKVLIKNLNEDAEADLSEAEMYIDRAIQELSGEAYDEAREVIRDLTKLVNEIDEN